MLCGSLLFQPHRGYLSLSRLSAACATLQAQAAQLAGYRSIRLCVASRHLPSMKELVIKGTVDPCFRAGS